MTRFSHGLITFTAALGLTLSAAACGDDDGGDDDGTTDDGTTDGTDDDGTDDDGTDDGASACGDHPNVAETDTEGVCSVSAGQSAPVTEALTLTADIEWLLDGPVFIGNDTDETILTIEAGTTIFGGDGSFLLIQRGSKIMAEGTAAAPILMTSALAEGDRGPEDWGGLVINGRATVNYGDPDTGEAAGEAGTGTYGGDQDDDNSGVLTYVVVEFAGNKVDTKNELNGIAFQGVGSGTTVDFIQTNMTSDDGVEFFGGAVSVKHLVVTGSDDDSIDWVGGWSGGAQYVVAQQRAESGEEAEKGIEADNFEDDNTLEPFSSPILSNFTLVGRAGNAAGGINFRRGTQGQLHNSIVTGFEGPCIDVDDPQTQTNITDGLLVVNNVVLSCTMGGFNAEAAPLADGAVVVEEDPLLDPATWQPAAKSPALAIGAGPDDPFFDDVDYAGAFDGETDWTEGWTSDAVE